MYTDCHFNESVYPTLRGENDKLVKEIIWNQTSLKWQDPRTQEYELEVQKMIYL